MLGMGWFPSTLGGLDRYFRSLLEELPEASAVVLEPAQEAPERVHLATAGDRPLPARLLAYWLAARRCAPGVELIDAHFALYAAGPLLLGALRGAPSVFHFHGPWADESLAAGEGGWIKPRLRRLLERAVLRHARAHVVLSGAFGRLLVERYRVLPWEIHVLPGGVDLEAFSPGEQASARARLGLQGGDFVAVCARRLVPRMGIEGLLDAWSELGGELSDRSRLLVVGEGPLQAQIEARAARPPLQGRVRVLGRVSDERLIDAYRAADVALVPSTALEGFGLVVLEAAACGTPSIVSDVGGLPEVAAPLDRSLLVPAGDSGALAARLREAAEGALPSRESTRRYAERFDWAGVASHHRRLYRRMARGEPDGRHRVVYLDHVARMSGGEIALLRMLPHLHGVNAHVILGEDGPLAGHLQQAGISLEVMPIYGAARDLRKETLRAGGPPAGALLGTLAYVIRLAARLRALEPDLIHTNSLKAAVYGSLAARASGVPVIWHARDRIAEDYLPRPAVRLVRTMIGRLADGVIANSEATAETLGPGRDGHPRCVIPDSVELSPHPRREAEGEGSFGMVGRIAPWKGQDLFLRAFAAAFPAGGARASIVGSAMFGEDDYERELAALASRLGIAERVSFRGFREDVWREMASFDVLVHASLSAEPFGQVVLEGMAAGLPVIAPDLGGPASLLEDGRTGRLFKSGDQQALAGAMRELAANPGLRARLGDGARRAAEGYHPATLAKRLEGFYASVLQGSE